ncbi:hypothetical protein [Nitrosospira sp. Nsp14]|uniref:hypothetical protein n=1 Tax=Nitrosospira sp. Nsp14 TaxID=1855333 RepID=UPI000B83B962|nr:hypothetical protein [Nitrosospira sp. Nsp14]
MGTVQLKEIYCGALPQVEVGHHFRNINVSIRRQSLGRLFYHIVLYDITMSLKGDMVEASKYLFISNTNGSGTIAVV